MVSQRHQIAAYVDIFQKQWDFGPRLGIEFFVIVHDQYPVGRESPHCGIAGLGKIIQPRNVKYFRPKSRAS